MHAVTLKYGYQDHTVNPVALLYPGRAIDALSAPPREGFFVSDYVDGPTLLERIKHLDDAHKQLIFFGIRDALDSVRQDTLKGYYLMDFAPRDIVLRDEFRPVLVDTEHLEFSAFYDSEKLLKRQTAEFNREYRSFLSKVELEKYRRIIFGR